jgi:TldD protein
MTLDAVIDAAEFLLDDLSERDAVAYAEVGGVLADRSNTVVNHEGIQSAADFTTSGIWWRVFAGGAAGYRYSSSLDHDHLSEMADRSVRSGELLAQNEPARYDAGSRHQATHPGWGDGTLADLAADAVGERLSTALDDATTDLTLERAHLQFDATSETLVFLTTTGTTLHTSLERASLKTSLVTPEANARDHVGATTGTRFLDDALDSVAETADRVVRIANHVTATPDPGRYDTLLAPHAAASLVAACAQYLELDTVYMGSSPYSVGDQFGAESLTIRDGVEAGSWAARAYDAEGRPTHPTTLVDDGEVTGLLTDTAGAAEEGMHPSGNVVASVGWEQPPRIAPRHLAVSPGETEEAALRADAAVAIERVGPPEFDNEATRTKRASGMPPSTPYARDIGSSTPSEFDDEASDQRLVFPVREGFRLDDGSRVARLDGASLVVSLDDLRSLSLGDRVTTATGVRRKHESVLPWAATAPAFRLDTTLDTR